MILLAQLAIAAPVNAKICVDYDLDFVDSGVGEDYYTSNGPEPARGVWVVASAMSSVSGYTATTGADIGCVTFSLDDAQQWTVKVLSKVQVATNQTLTVHNGSNNALFEKTILTNYTPYAFVTEQKTLPAQSNWNALAVASRALTRNDAGLSTFAIKLYVPNSSGSWTPPAGCDPNASCLNGTDLWLHSDEADRKFLTAYRLGWVMLHLMGYDRSTVTKTADDTNCHVSNQALTLGNLEHTAAGFVQGYAHWYSASAFNVSGESDCEYVFWRPSNWDQLDVCHEEFEAAEGHTVSFEVGPKLPPYYEIVPDTNFRSYCLDERNPGLASTSKPDDTAVPLDVMRFFHLRDYLDSGVSRSDIGKIIAAGISYQVPSDAPTFRLAVKTQAVVEGANEMNWIDAASDHGINQ